ncbi:MAG: glycosyltransferase family 4 protein [Bacteroidetes bacterium]|nr:glycosyltransferase family 4 protein [Bacteroidota bacterium]
MPKVLLVHPGTQYSQYLAAQLQRLGLLHIYYTGLAIPEDGLGGFLYGLLPGRIKKKLVNRVLHGVPAAKLKNKPWIELAALYAISRGRKSEEVFFRRNSRFQASIPDALLRSADVVVGFDTSSWLLVKRCKELGIPFILDISIGHPLAKEQVFAELLKKYPAWTGQITPKDKQLIALEAEEAQMADCLVVPSRFVERTYQENGFAGKKIRVNPFGTELEFFSPKKYERQNNATRFLFFGGLTARKGLPFLLEAWQKLITRYPGRASLTIAGFGQLPPGVLLPEGVTNRGTVKGADRVSLYHAADVFVFPSFFEGFAQVQVEAAACGLPLITTVNAGGENIVTGKQGILIAGGQVDELLAAMVFFINNPDACEAYGRNARDKVLQEFTWDAYGERWKKIIDTIDS